MNCQSYAQLVSHKQWADRGLCDVAGQTLDTLPDGDAAIMLRILDHLHAVDKIFQHHLLGTAHTFKAARSEDMPEFQALVDSMKDADDWYVSYVAGLTEGDLEQPVEFVFTSGKPGCMQRGEILLHVCLHGTYHRGNAGILLQKNGIMPNRDGLTDFLDAVPLAMP